MDLVQLHAGSGLRPCGSENVAHSINCPNLNNFIDGKYLHFAVEKQKCRREIISYGFWNQTSGVAFLRWLSKQ